MRAKLFASEELLSPTPIEMVSEEDAVPDLPPAAEQGGLSAEQLQDYLRKLNPEDLGRFNP